jgi:hypothetical protein
LRAEHGLPKDYADGSLHSRRPFPQSEEIEQVKHADATNFASRCRGRHHVTATAIVAREAFALWLASTGRATCVLSRRQLARAEIAVAAGKALCARRAARLRHRHRSPPTTERG